MEAYAIDNELTALLVAEEKRQHSVLNLIASENVATQGVKEALGSVLTNKYAEGYPGNRYHLGCEVVDQVENLAISRARKLFGAEYVNVQSNSGSSANFSTYAAFAQPGDTVLSLGLMHGGHQSHGSKVNFSGKWFNVVNYHVREKTELIDYQEIRDLAHGYRPRIIIAGATNYSRLIDYSILREIANEVHAILWVDAAHIAGLVAAQAIPSPVEFADVITAVTHKVFRGPRGGFIMSRETSGTALDKAVFPFNQSGPAMNVIAAKAAAFGDAETAEYRSYVQGALENCRELITHLHNNGLRPISGGSDTHLAVFDLTALGISGADAAHQLAAANILVDKAVIPFDPLPLDQGSGIRLGTAAITAAGLKPTQMATVAELIVRALDARRSTTKILADVANSVSELFKSGLE